MYEYKEELIQQPILEPNEPTQNSIEKYPIDTVTRIQDQFTHKSSYLQPINLYFSCDSFDYGTPSLRKKLQISKKIKRYFAKRYFYFSMFDHGILLDEESWYSVIPEPISLYLAERFQSVGVKSIFEPFSGVGGIAVHFCQNFSPYWVNDIDPNKIVMLKNNVKVYGKKLGAMKILNKDFFQVQPQNFDMILVCPPWGGIDITAYAYQDLDEIMFPKLSDILLHCKKFSKNICLQMPKNTNIQNLIKTLNLCFIAPLIQIQKVFVDGKLSQLFVYLGDPTFTQLSNQIYSTILYDAFGVKHAINFKQAKKDLKMKIKFQNFEIFSHIYQRFRPNKHLFLDTSA